MSFPEVETLRHAFPAEQLVLYGFDDAFGKLNSSYLSSLESEIVPTGIFLPKTSGDVSKFILVFKEYALDGLSGQIASMLQLETPFWQDIWIGSPRMLT